MCENKALELGTVSEGLRDGSGEGVIGEVEILEAWEVADGGREATGEIVTVEEYAVKGSGIEELNGNGTMEGIGVEVQATEID